MTITAERRQDYGRHFEGVVHQVHVTLAGSPTPRAQAICHEWALSCARTGLWSRSSSREPCSRKLPESTAGKRLSRHALRHSAGSIWLTEHGRPITTVSAMMGHSAFENRGDVEVCTNSPSVSFTSPRSRSPKASHRATQCGSRRRSNERRDGQDHRGAATDSWRDARSDSCEHQSKRFGDATVAAASNAARASDWNTTAHRRREQGRIDTLLATSSSVARRATAARARRSRRRSARRRRRPTRRSRPEPRRVLPCWLFSRQDGAQVGNRPRVRERRDQFRVDVVRAAGVPDK